MRSERQHATKASHVPQSWPAPSTHRYCTTHPYRRPQYRPSLFHPTLTNQPISLPHSGAMAKSEAAAKTPRTLTLWKRQKLKKKMREEIGGKEHDDDDVGNLMQC